MINIRGITPNLTISVLFWREMIKVLINLLNCWHQLDQQYSWNIQGLPTVHCGRPDGPLLNRRKDPGHVVSLILGTPEGISTHGCNYINHENGNIAVLYLSFN